MLVRPDLSPADEIDTLVDPREWLAHNAPRRKRASPERSAQVSVVAALKRSLPPGSIVAAVKNEHAPKGLTKEQRIRFFAKRKAEGVNAGFPDLIILLPGGRTFLLEMKAPKNGRLSDAQREMHAAIRAIGHEVGVARCIDSALLALRQAGVAVRARS
jgi:hypothetical protein